MCACVHIERSIYAIRESQKYEEAGADDPKEWA